MVSNITNILLMCSGSDIRVGAIERLNRKLEEHERLRVFVGLTEGKGDTSTIYSSWANYLNEDALVKVIESVAWRYPLELQLFLKNEDSHRYSEHELNPLRLDMGLHNEWVPDPDGGDYDPFTETRGNWELHEDSYVVTRDGQKVHLVEPSGGDNVDLE